MGAAPTDVTNPRTAAAICLLCIAAILYVVLLEDKCQLKILEAQQGAEKLQGQLHTSQLRLQELQADLGEAQVWVEALQEDLDAALWQGHAAREPELSNLRSKSCRRRWTRRCTEQMREQMIPGAATACHLDNTTIEGVTALQVDTKRTPTECQAACALNSSCAAFSYNVSSRACVSYPRRSAGQAHHRVQQGMVSGPGGPARPTDAKRYAVLFRGGAFRAGCNAKGIQNQRTIYESVRKYLVGPLIHSNDGGKGTRAIVDVFVAEQTPCSGVNGSGGEQYKKAIRGAWGDRLKFHIVIHSLYQGPHMREAVTSFMKYAAQNVIEYDFLFVTRNDLQLQTSVDSWACSKGLAQDKLNIAAQCPPERREGRERCTIDLLYRVPNKYFDAFHAAIVGDHPTRGTPYGEMKHCGCYGDGVGWCGSGHECLRSFAYHLGDPSVMNVQKRIASGMRNIGYCWRPVHRVVREGNPNYYLAPQSADRVAFFVPGSENNSLRSHPKREAAYDAAYNVSQFPREYRVQCLPWWDEDY
jgi:hypothetical protein